PRHPPCTLSRLTSQPEGVSSLLVWLRTHSALLCSARNPHEHNVHSGCCALYALLSIFSLTLQQ
ncbi:hypothetical protein, partial [Yersinia kristensenii]|uniref:hypothetical protein n=1 Tax=Yersinia kristensenii TaxID=28152 RepID=UPI001C608EB8